MKFEISKLILAFIVLINPFSALSLFLELTRNYSKRDRRKVAQIASLSVFIIVLIFTFSGNALLKALGISTGSFQIGGGILVFLIAVSMMSSGSNPAKPDIGTAEHNEITIRQPDLQPASIAVVPLAIPMMIGPGGISTVIIHAAAARTWHDYAAVLAAGLFVSTLCYVSLMAAAKVSKLLGDTGLAILNRVMGMLLAAVAVEIIVAGLRSLFPQLAA